MDIWQVDSKLIPFKSPGGAFHIYEFYPGIGIRIPKNMPPSKYLDYSGFKTDYTDKEIIKDELMDYKTKIGRGKEDIIRFFDDKRKNLIKKIK